MKINEPAEGEGRGGRVESPPPAGSGAEKISVAGQVLRRVEFPLKRTLFHCRHCGACLLDQTRFLCPMNCPKGLRNGPCGGARDGRCGVTERPCVWMRILDGEGGVFARRIHAPLDFQLLETSSWHNGITGRDRETRKILPFPLLPSHPRLRSAQTASGLERRLRSGELAITAEIRSPRASTGLDRCRSEIEALLPWVDAFHVTSGHAGTATIPAFETAQQVVRLGGEAILPACGRDLAPAEFLDLLLRAAAEGMSNVFCLTGDWPAGAKERRERFFRMDSSQMIYEARQLRDTGCSAFARETLRGKRAPRFFIGAAAHPAAAPSAAALSRLAQKIRCGLDFIQTQMVFDPEAFFAWHDALERHGLRERVHLIASVPVLAGKKFLEVCRRLDGAGFSGARLAPPQTETDLAGAGAALARRIMDRLLERGAVDGFHLSGLGASPAQIGELARYAREKSGRRKFVGDLEVSGKPLPTSPWQGRRCFGKTLWERVRVFPSSIEGEEGRNADQDGK